MDQSSIDALLAQVQSDADALKDAAAPGGAAAVGAVAQAKGQADSITQEARGEPAAALVPNSDVHRLLAIEVPVIVQLGVRRMTVGEVMRLGVGAIVEFSKSAVEELDLLANNKPIGKGHAVKVGENFGIKISSIGSVKETIRRLGGN